MTDLPKTIRVGYRDFAVKPMTAYEAQSVNRFGECDVRNGVIKVCTEYGAAKAANTLLHEVLHAAWFVGYLDGHTDEEPAVGTLANVLSEVWRDNPEFIAFMSESLK